MPNPHPVDGRCNGKRKDGTYCANRPHLPAHLGGNGRCKFHGGMPRSAAQIEAARNNKKNTKHGFYARSLSNAFADPAMQEAMRQMDAGTDMSVEIQFWRTKVLEYQLQISKGNTLCPTGANPDGTQRYADYETLLVRASAMLAKLTRDQHEMHPEVGLSGNLQISIMVSGGAASAAAGAADDLQDLEAAPPPEADPNATGPTGDAADELLPSVGGALDDVVDP